jgi:DNA-directed RNA polymerase subunit beta'
MSYVAIPSNLKHIHSLSLELMSSDDISEMSYGEVLTSETINYRTGTPQMNGLFCQAIFGPVKQWECACGKYKRYRYAGVICDKCGVEVTQSSVRRERMGHISLAAPCAHPWFFRIVPSRISLLLDMKSIDISRVVYFSAYIIVDINTSIRDEYLDRIDKEAKQRLKILESEYDGRFDELSKNFQKSKSEGTIDEDILKVKYDADKELLKNQKSETISRIEAIGEVARKELTALHYKQVITELQYQELSQKFGAVFRAGIGAEAIKTLLREVDLNAEVLMLNEKIIKAKGETKRKLVKRLKLIKYFLANNTKPEWMILDRVMVLPPDLRPMLQLDGGRFATSDLNELYRRLINRNNRLRKLIQIGAPEVILRNEKRMLQEAVEALIDNSARGGKQVMASTGIRRPLKSLTDILKGKQGRFRQNLLGKRVDYSGRSVIVVGPKLTLAQCGIPKEMALELFTPFLIGGIIKKSEDGILSEEDQAFNVHSARRLIENKHPIIYDILEEVIKDKYVLLNRAPTLHKLSFLAFQPILIEGRAIQLHPLTCAAFNADFDGDQMAVHLPITQKGQEEAKNLMVATKNLIKPATGEMIMHGKQDIILGAYYLTAITKQVEEKLMRKFASFSEVLMALDHGVIALGEAVVARIKNKETGKKERIVTTAGRILFNKAFPKNAPYYNYEVNKKNYEKIVNEAYHELGADVMPDTLDNIKNIAFQWVTQSGITMSVFDMKIPEEKHALIATANEKVEEINDLYSMGLMNGEDKHTQIINVWSDTIENVTALVKDKLDPLGNVGLMINSGSRGNMAQLTQMAGMKGLVATATGETIELATQHSYIEGLSPLEYFITTKGSRKSQADISLKTADSGYLTRRLVDVAQNIIISTEDDLKQAGKLITIENSTAMGKTIWQRIYGRYVINDVSYDGQIIIKANNVVDFTTLQKYKELPIDNVLIYSITKSTTSKGIDQKSYGLDFSSHKPAQLGTPVGILAAQSLGEPSTQLTMNSKHRGGISTKADITSGLPRVEEILEVRNPRLITPLADFAGEVSRIEGSIESGYTISIQKTEQTLSLPYTKDVNVLVEDGKQIESGDPLFVNEHGEASLAGVGGVIEIDSKEIRIRSDRTILAEYDVAPGLPLKIKKGDKVHRAMALAEGSIVMQDLMDKAGMDTVEDYIINELNAIYSSNGIDVNEKHIEVIVRQMCSKVQVLDPGESELTIGDVSSYTMVTSINRELRASSKRPVVFKRLIIGISKSSLSTDSFLAAASFQETSRVLVEAVLSGRKDSLSGLKENVILGQLIPAGTGYHEDRINSSEILEEYTIE